jgi:hypothetical protein
MLRGAILSSILSSCAKVGIIWLLLPHRLESVVCMKKEMK